MNLYSTILINFLQTGKRTATPRLTERELRILAGSAHLQLKRAVDTSSRSYTRSASHTVEKACCRPSWFTD
jgi:hypothetical protein